MDCDLENAFCCRVSLCDTPVDCYVQWLGKLA